MITIKAFIEKLKAYPEDWIVDFQETGSPSSLLELSITQNRKLYYEMKSAYKDYTVHDNDMTLHMIVRAPDEKSGGW